MVAFEAQFERDVGKKLRPEMQWYSTFKFNEQNYVSRWK